MRLRSACLAATLLLVPAVARAQLVDMAFDDCPDGAGATRAQSDACNSNTGDAMRIVVSFVLPFGAPVTLNGVTAEILVSTPYRIGGPSFTEWWRLDSCRVNAASVEVGIDSDGCLDPWTSGAFADQVADVIPAGFDGYHGTPMFVRMRVEVASSAPVLLQSDVKYHAFTLNIRRIRTLGPGACTGCCEGACLFLDRMVFNMNGGEFEYRPFGSPFLSWQGGSYGEVRACWTDRGCPVPTRRGTWGELKALYR